MGEEMKVKTLRERFQNDDFSRSRTKPAIPEKPKTIPPISPTSKISNPLIASINSAVENRMAPRVVFKDDKKTRPLSQPETSEVKPKPILLDKNQKKEADLIKQAMKDKKILPTSPVSPVLEQKPKHESIPKSPGLETPVKVPTPFKNAIVNKRDNDEEGMIHFSEWDVPATPVLDHSDSSISTHAKAEATDKKSVVPKALVPPVRANPTITPQVISPRVISPPAFSPSKSPALKVPHPVHQNGPQMEIPRPEVPLRHNSQAISPTADIFTNNLPEAATTIPESSDIFDMNIPPPIFPEDFSDGPSDVDISPYATSEPLFPWASLSATPVLQSPPQYHTDSSFSYSEPVFTFSPLPASISPSMNFESIAENRVTESPKLNDHTEKPLEVPLLNSPSVTSVVSALARAEEMSPVKHNSCDQRLLKLLEKAKRGERGKTIVGTQLSTPEILPVLEEDLPSNSPLVSSPPETAHAEPVLHVDASNAPEPFVNLLDIPPVDYEGKAEKAANAEYNIEPHGTSLNNQDHMNSSPAPKMVVVQRPVMPPPPPPRKPLSSVPNGGLTPEKPPQLPSKDMKSTIQPSLPLEDKEIIIHAPAEFNPKDSRGEDTEIWDLAERVGSQDNAPDHRNSVTSVHEGAFFEHLNPKHQNLHMDSTDTGLPKTVATEYSDSATNSLSSPALLSPTGKQFSYSSTDLEDMATGKKSKAPKKLRKGSPKNPYAETPVVTEEHPKKIFSKKNSVSDEKEMKLKEKQRQKDKEKEKEKEKEQKEKEKEKKEQKDKKKEQKEKELKEKEKDKKELKEKEKEKKGQKEKDKEKKEQKEKEKKENEIKKKFKITGEEEALYQAKVTESTKGRKDDLGIKAGDIVSIIRTTDCPKGKWLARDSTNKYGYIPVESVELDIEEMMVLGNKAKANNKPSINGIIDSKAPSIDMSSHHYSLNQESFEDDSEEWGDDDDDAVFPADHTTDIVLNQLASPDSGPKTVPALPAHTDRSDTAQGGREVIHKLTTFFAQPTVPVLQSNTPIKEPVMPVVCVQEPVSSLKQEVELQILPPPDSYADLVMG
ncbi:transcription initiation factor TFIID subunit 3 isoform X2 [Tachysurus vachellii]|uniref:transcription initiation factor TFIID subunit 3 isoform X2 n=1 Tax=Tachysurus vachellii TaxID=175792 RepID=UPI00296AE69B|nr:transcription initiation factor TFIID subunit 3 isoform X2 [Tachysurus vachellii]